MKNILIVSPHPDDEVLGCGGTILKYKKNKIDVNWLICTKMKESKKISSSLVKKRKKEIEKIEKLLGFKKLFQLDFETKEIHKVSESLLIEKITNVINSIKPNTLYLPFINDAHSDHRIITSAFNACIKPFRNSYLEKILMYETLSETNLNYLSSRKFVANVFNDISPFINTKITAMNIYKSEIGKHPFPRNDKLIKSLAILRGSESNFKYAEAFELVYQRIRS